MKKKIILLLCCALYALAMILTIGRNHITIKPMYIPAHIGRTLTDSVKHKK